MATPTALYANLLAVDPQTAHLAERKDWKRVWIKQEYEGHTLILQAANHFALVCERENNLWVVAVGDDAEPLKSQVPTADAPYPGELIAPTVPYLLRFARSWEARMWITRMNQRNVADEVVAEVVEALANGVDPNYEEGNFTLLTSACGDTDNHLKLIRLLVAAGADLERGAKTHGGRSERPLLLAAARRDIRALELFLDLGAKVDARDSQGQTALYVAAQRENEACVRALLDAGANMDLPDKNGTTPFMVGERWQDLFVQYRGLAIERATPGKSQRLSRPRI